MRVVLLLLIVGAGMGGGVSRAQPWAFERVEGLPHNTVSALLQDHRGFLWIGTADGLARYDGRRFRVFQRADGGLPSNTIQALAETDAGDLWVGTSAGACRLVDEASGRFDCPAPRIDVLDVLPTDGTVWAITIDGAWRLDAGADTFRLVGRGALDPPGSLDVERFAAAREGLRAVEGELGGRSYRRLRYDAMQGHFVLTEDGRLRAGEVALLGPSGSLVTLPSAPFSALGDALTGWDALGRVSMVTDTTAEWIGGELGLFRRTGSFVERIPLGEESPLGRSVLALALDRSGALWVGTRSGLYVRDPARERFTHLDPTVVGTAAPVMAVATDAAGDLWVGTLGGGLVRRRGRDAEAVGDPDAVVWALHATDDGLWVGADGGLCRRSPGAAPVCLRESLARADGSVYVYDLEPDGAGGLWVGGSVLALVDARSGQVQRRVSLDGVGTLTVLHRDRRGRLWVGIEKRGLWRLDSPDGTLRRIPVAGLAEASVWSMEAAADGIWLGTSEGLFLLDPAEATAQAHAPDLPGSTVYGVLADGAALWLTTGQGLARYRPADGALRLFGPDDGVRNVEFNRRALHRGPDGRVHAGGLRGLTSFDPAAFDEESVPPSAVVTRLRVEGASGEAVYAGPDVHLGPDARVVAFDVAAPIPTGAASVRYAYRLDPLDQDWVEVDGDVIRFAGLAPGPYTFQVRASRGDGVWGDAASVTVTLAPPWYQTWWARSLAALVLAGAVGVAVQARIRTVRREERMRWRIASDLHDDIGSGLASVALLAERVRDQGTLAAPEATQLTSVARAARSMVESLREIVWFVDPAHERPGASSARIREVAASIVGPGVSVVAPTQSRLDTAPLAVRRDVFLILKEALHNAARHAEGSAVRVTLREEAGTLVLTVADEGPGFDPEAARDGTGLRSLHRRADALGGALDVDSAPGQGTTIRLRALCHEPNTPFA